jgi:hypothetical protein
MNNKKFYWIGGFLLAGVIIGARYIFVKNETTQVSRENFTDETIYELTNGHPESLAAPVNDATDEQINQDWEQMLNDIPTQDLQSYLDENSY